MESSELHAEVDQKSSSKEKKSSDKDKKKSSDRKKSSDKDKKKSSDKKKTSDKDKKKSSDKKKTSDKTSTDKKAADKHKKADTPTPAKHGHDQLAQDADEMQEINGLDQQPKIYAPMQHLVFEEPDSLLGSLYVEHPAPLLSHRITVEIDPIDIPLGQDSAYSALLEQWWNPVLREISHRSDYITSEPDGIPGDPVDYEFRTDDVVTSVFMLSFFILAWVIASSWKFVRSQLRDFFITRERPNLFAEREDNELHGRALLVVQTCFLVVLLFFDIIREYLPDVFEQVSPYLLLGAATGISIGYYLFKITMYNIVNYTFFSPAKCKLWNDIHYVSILVTGCSLLPIVLFVVFFDMPFEHTALACILLLSVIKILMLYKCSRIFFNTLLGGVHLILYFCALEIVPLGFFAAALVAASMNLLYY